MIRRHFLQTTLAAGMAAGFRSASADGSGIESRSAAKPKYRAGVTSRISSNPLLPGAWGSDSNLAEAIIWKPLDQP
jgi:hypothetical protein